MNVSGALADLLGRWTALEAPAAILIARLLSIILTAVVLYVAYRVVTSLVTRGVAAAARVRVPGTDRGHALLRSRTLGSLLTNVVKWTLGFVAIVVILRELGIDVQAIVVSAGVLGLAVGLGAQTLIRDVITGVFLLFEGLIGVGDLIQVGPHSGTVEAIGLRVTQLRMPDGALRIVPNGTLTEFTNFSSGWARAIVDVGVPREADVTRALEVLRRVGEEWARDTGAALDPPRSQGIMKFIGGGDVVLRLVVRVEPGRRDDAEIELRRRIKDAFDHERWSALGVS